MGYSTASSSDDGRNPASRKRQKKKKERKSSRKKREKSIGDAEEERDDVFARVDQQDVKRRLLSLLQPSPQIEVELLEIFEQLDSWGIVYLQELGEPGLRKKLRHLFRALILSEVEGERGRGWRKLPAFKKSLSKVIKRLCKELHPQLHASDQEHQLHHSEPAPVLGEKAREQPVVFDVEKADRRAEEAVLRWRTERAAIYEVTSPLDSSPPDEALNATSSASAGVPAREEWMLEAPAYLRCLASEDRPDSKRRRAEILQQKRKDDEEAVRIKAVMEEWNKTRKLRSLREMRQDGDFAEGEEAYRRWKRSMEAARNVWGKRAAEQATEEEFKDDAKRGQPWQRFDRDRDLQVVPQVSQAEYEKLLQQTKLGERFKSSWQTSFL